MAAQDQASSAASRAVETLHTVLIDVGWNPQKDEETAGFVVRFDPPYIPVAYAYAVISPDLELFVFYLNFGVAAAEERRDETSQYLALANWNLMSGNFEMDYEDGMLRFRTSVPFQGTELSDTLIRNTIRFAMDAVERYAEGAIDVMARGKSARHAFNDAASSGNGSAPDPAAS